jgi:Ca2+-binding RTX toxin-like protein
MIFGTDDRQLTNYSSQYNTYVQIKSTFSDGVTLQSSGVINADHFYLTEEWVLNKSLQYDYGVISLEIPIGYYTGIVNYGYINDLMTTANTNMTAFGYAGDIDVLLFRDDMDASGGQSGSAVVIQDEQDQDVVIGLVSHQSYYPDENGIFAFSNESISNIDRWIRSNDENLVSLKTTTKEFNDVQAVSHLYTALLGRIADEDGLRYWTEQLSTYHSYDDIINGFLESDELKNNSDYTKDNTSFIASLYSNILGRTPDTQGFEYWLDELDYHSTKSKVIGGFLDSSEYSNTQSLTTYTLWHNLFESFSREVSGSNQSEILKTTNKDDYIYGNIGNDTLYGGDGGDFFVFDLTQDGIDTIMDFDISHDKIKLLSSNDNIKIANITNTDTLVLYETVE